MQQLQNRSYGMLSSSGGSNGNGGRGGWRRPAATGDHGESGGQGQGPWASYLRALETSPVGTPALAAMHSCAEHADRTLQCALLNTLWLFVESRCHLDMVCLVPCTRQILTKAITSAIISFLGNVVAQVS